ncbi:hypothetical protein BC829DRAFT_454644 [Chytridium lagenaria]|nr:hypothetical protein BC829DRAFT_454644 [Chytridium lagenaria]
MEKLPGQSSTPPVPPQPGAGAESEREETSVKAMKRQLSQGPNIPVNQAKLHKTQTGVQRPTTLQPEDNPKDETEMLLDDEDTGRQETANHDASWDEMRFVDGCLVNPPTHTPKLQSDTTSREQTILAKLEAAPTATALRNIVNELPPAHTTPKIMALLLKMMGSLIQCHHCDGRSTTQWEKMGSDGRSKCSTVQSCATLDGVRWESQNATPPEIKTVFRTMFSTPQVRKPPTPKVDLEILTRASVDGIAKILRTPADMLHFKDVQKIINTQEALIIGLREYNTQLIRGFKQLSQDFHNAKAISAALAANQTLLAAEDEPTPNSAMPRPHSSTAYQSRPSLIDIAKLAETEQAAAYQRLMSSRRNPLPTIPREKDSRRHSRPININSYEDIHSPILREKVSRMKSTLEPYAAGTHNGFLINTTEGGDEEKNKEEHMHYFIKSVAGSGTGDRYATY